MATAPIPGVDGYFADESGVIWSAKPGRYGRYSAMHKIKPHFDKNGYMQVTLRPNGTRQRFAVHALIALAFIGERPAAATIAHLDGDNQNNRASNLAYVSQRENIAQRWQHGTMIYGEKSHLSKINDDTAKQIWQSIKNGASNAKIAKEFGVSRAYGADMRHGRIRKHITGIWSTD